MKIAYFDLETQYLFDEVGGRQNTHKLKVALAGTLIGEEVNVFTEDEVDHLIKKLLDCDMIVGHNLSGFDYLVLSPYVDSTVIQSLKAKTFDTFDDLKAKTGCWIGLDDLGKRNLNMQKTENSIEIPGMWRAGKHQEVKDYLINDLKLIKAVHEHGKLNKSLKYDHKVYGESEGEKIVSVDWD